MTPTPAPTHLVAPKSLAVTPPRPAGDQLAVPGMGTFSIAFVGNTSYTTGVRIGFHRKGEPKRIGANWQGRLSISDTFHPTWEITRYVFGGAAKTGPLFGEDADAKAFDLFTLLHETHPGQWLSYVADVTEQEIDALEREQDELRRQLARARNWLAAAEGGNPRPVTDPDDWKKTVTDTLERATRRCDRAAAKLSEFEQKLIPRIAILKRGLHAMRAWQFNARGARKLSVAEVVRQGFDGAWVPPARNTWPRVKMYD